MTNLKKDIHRILHPDEIKKEDLHPPMAPTDAIDSLLHALPDEWKTSEIDLKSMPKEYWDYCDSNDAKRAWKLARFGKTHRGTTADLKRQVIQQNKELEIGKEINSLLRGSKADYKEVMKELKEKLAQKKEVIDRDDKVRK
jgi:hypothetical protein